MGGLVVVVVVRGASVMDPRTPCASVCCLPCCLHNRVGVLACEQQVEALAHGGAHTSRLGLA